jgi:hypothetical protein
LAKTNTEDTLDVAYVIPEKHIALILKYIKEQTCQIFILHTELKNKCKYKN